MTSDLNFTGLIQQMLAGDRSAGETVFTTAAARLRRMAQSLMANECTRGFHASDLVQETFLQKVSRFRMRRAVANREHFFSYMAAGMRQVLIDRSRVRRARKRQPLPVEDILHYISIDDRQIHVANALHRLEKLDSEGRHLMYLKFELGLTWDEVAQRTGKPLGQMRAECSYVLMWLRRELE